MRNKLGETTICKERCQGFDQKRLKKLNVAEAKIKLVLKELITVSFTHITSYFSGRI